MSTFLIVRALPILAILIGAIAFGTMGGLIATGAVMLALIIGVLSVDLGDLDHVSAEGPQAL